jgi:hypothetical protein
MSNPRQSPSEKLPPNGNTVALADNNPRSVVSITPTTNFSVLSGLIICRPSLVRPPSITRIMTNRNEITPIMSDVIRLSTMPSAKPPAPPTPICAISKLTRVWSMSKSSLRRRLSKRTMKDYWRHSCVNHEGSRFEIDNSRQIHSESVDGDSIGHRSQVGFYWFVPHFVQYFAVIGIEEPQLIQYLVGCVEGALGSLGLLLRTKMTTTDMTATIRTAAATANSGRVKRANPSVVPVVDVISLVLDVVTIIVDDDVNELVVIEVIPV